MKNKLNQLLIGKFIGVIVACFIGLNANAQQFNVQGDLVSSYVWRGVYQTSASVQPTLGFSVGNFSLTAWGSVDFKGVGKEADLTAAYSINGLTLSLTDYWWEGEGKGNYFRFKNHETAHKLEGGIAYSLPLENFPLNLSWYTIFWGGDKKANGKNAYSTYTELAYPFSVKNVDLSAMVGFSPFASPTIYKNDGFAVTNISLRANKEIQITDKFSLPIFVQTIWNPQAEDVHFVFGITLR